MTRRALSFLAGVAGPALAAAHRLSGRRAGLIVLFHLVSDRQGDHRRELVAPIERSLYERQLRHLCRHYHVVSLEELPAAVKARRRWQRHPVSVTFDDDAAEHTAHALPALRERGVNATFFLNGSWADREREPAWWHDLQRATDAGLAPTGQALFRSAYKTARLAPAQRDAEAARLRALTDPGQEGAMSEGQVSELVRSGQSLGFHTRRHYSLPALDDAELEAEMTAFRAEIERLAGAPLKQFSYPHGDFDDRVVDAVRAHRFTIGVTCRRTAITPHTEPLRLGRVEIKGASLGDFVAQVVRGLLSRG